MDLAKESWLKYKIKVQELKIKVQKSKVKAWWSKKTYMRIYPKGPYKDWAYY